MEVKGEVKLEMQFKIKRIEETKKGSDILAFLGLKGRKYQAEIEFWQNGKLQQTVKVREGDSINIE